MRLRIPQLPIIGTPHRKGAAFFRWRTVVMAKEPILGRVKTRLSRDIGPAQATRFYRSTAAAVIGRLAADPRFETLLGVSPDLAIRSRSIPGLGVRRLAQGHGDLGDRMLRLARAAPPGPVIVVGTDIPGISNDLIDDAFRRLGDHDLVIGPAEDGGFWLIGFSRRRPLPRDIFAHVRWSHQRTRDDMLANCAGLKVAFATPLPDVDTFADLASHGSVIGRRILPAASRATIPQSGRRRS